MQKRHSSTCSEGKRYLSSYQKNGQHISNSNVVFKIPVGICRYFAVQDTFGVVRTGFPRAPHASGSHPSGIQRTPIIAMVDEKTPTISVTASSLNRKVVLWYEPDIRPRGGKEFAL